MLHVVVFPGGAREEGAALSHLTPHYGTARTTKTQCQEARARESNESKQIQLSTHGRIQVAHTNTRTTRTSDKAETPMGEEGEGRQ